MLLSHSRIFVFVLLAIPVGVVFLQTSAQADAGAAPASCHVSIPSQRVSEPALPVPGTSSIEKVGKFGTDKLWTLLPIDGIWRGSIPRGPGEYAYSNKLPWGGDFSYRDGPLTVTGRRTDGPAPSFTEIEPISWPRQFMGGINIPVFGCWEIVSRYKDHELRFTVWVEPLPDQEMSTPASKEAFETEPAPRRIETDGPTEAKNLVYRVSPTYEPRFGNVSGTVILHAIIGTDGRPRQLRHSSGPQLLTQAAIDTVTWWQYMVTDENTEVETTIPVVFPPTNN